MADNIVQLHPQRPRTFGDWLSLDTFANLIAVFGLPGRDKVVSQVPVLELLDTNSLEALYRGDWVSRKIVDIPASDSTRAWRTWNATKQQVKALEETERTFGIQRKLLSASRSQRTSTRSRSGLKRPSVACPPGRRPRRR